MNAIRKEFLKAYLDLVDYLVAQGKEREQAQRLALAQVSKAAAAWRAADKRFRGV